MRDHGVAVEHAAAERELRPQPDDLLAAALAPRAARAGCGSCRSSARSRRCAGAAARTRPGTPCPRRSPACVTPGASGLIVRLLRCVWPGVVQEQPGHAARSRRGSSRPARRRACCSARSGTASPARSAGGGRTRSSAGRGRSASSERNQPSCSVDERAGVAAVAGLVVGVDPEHAQPVQVAAEVRRLVAREELVVEAVVALPLADAARRVRGADVRAVVVAAGHEVVAAGTGRTGRAAARPGSGRPAPPPR